MRVSRKNISLFLHDVRPPSHRRIKQPTESFEFRNKAVAIKASSRRLEVSTVALQDVKTRQKDATFLLSGIVRHRDTPRTAQHRGENIMAPVSKAKRSRVRFTLLLVAGLLLVSYVLSLYSMSDNALTAVYGMRSSLITAINSFQNLETDKAALSLLDAEKNLELLRNELRGRGLFGISSLFGAIFPVVKNARLSFENLEIALKNATLLNGDIVALKNQGLTYFMKGSGKELTALLESMREHLGAAVKAGEALHGLSASLKNSIFSNYFTLPSGSGDPAIFGEGYAAEEFLGALISMLKREMPTRLLLLFQNPSEIRPSGGFIGSYAMLTIKNGALDALDVRDIYDPDGWVEKKIVPPKQLWITTSDWEARDANWFADFRLSAKKVIGRLEDSLFYKEKNITFDGAIALNTNVVEELLTFTGPIELPEYNLVITDQNFLEEVQFEVEAGRNKLKNQPKKILSDMTPRLLARLTELPNEKKQKLVESLGKHLTNKDIQIYFRDTELENFMEKYGISGAIFEIPQNWSGDYLAIVNANVAGGKTDVYIDQNIKVSSTLDILGNLTDTVTVERNHKGGKTHYSWYNVTNKSYIRVLTPLGAGLAEIQGETERVISAKENYSASGYTTDLDIALLERENRESGKNVFAAWRYTNPGKTSALTFSYIRDSAVKPKDGATYQFVFDKQSGVTGGITYNLQAPLGFRWRESGSSAFSYVNENPPARLVIDLTLEEI